MAMRGMLLVVGLLLAVPGWTAEVDPRADCLSCHRGRDPLLATAWDQRRGCGARITCHGCHGEGHDGGMAVRARKAETCRACHAAVGEGYDLSKHGVIVRLEGDRMDFTQPLREGNQRAPTCAYCHLHGGDHALGRGVFSLEPGASGDLETRREERAAPCRDCHAPRFVETWFSSGDQMVEIGRLKVREAREAVKVLEHRDGGLGKTARALLAGMEEHLRQVVAGVGHQSPDQQWWHGMAALDGDLLRIKSLGSERRLRGSDGAMGK